jgi:hypothetical protein
MSFYLKLTKVSRGRRRRLSFDDRVAVRIFKRYILLSVLFLVTVFGTTNSTAQERFGRTLNLGVGVGYYGYIGHSFPGVDINYEFDVARNFTLAPFVKFFSYRNYIYWGSGNMPYKDYYYRETVIPIGVKGMYYFDELFAAGDRWDFYGGGSLGFAYRSVVWESGYEGTTNINRGTGPLYLDFHIGTEYHINDRLGMYLDLSSGMSTIGLAFHPSGTE